MNNDVSCSTPSVGTPGEVDLLHRRPVDGHEDLALDVVAQAVELARPFVQVAVQDTLAELPHAVASLTPVTVTTLYDQPLPCAWLAYHSSLASSDFASVGIHPSR